ncbi:MAG: MBL fold metallo-hydrolase [Candidatus Nanoarchaeia archaeon]|nr:MBL fold metallo-hydrolase [Candidatus Nanoarchaeia archaeon]
MKAGGVEIEWLGHSGFMIKSPDNKIIYIDPYSINENSEKADLILITHSHHDHCSIADINKIIKPNSRVVITADCQSKIMKTNIPIKIEITEPGQEFDFGNIRISSIPAYNKDKSFHPQDESWVGYIIKINGTTVYHAGDTDVIPEMQKLTGHKKNGSELIVLLPIGGRFTMNVEEALEAAKIIKPNIAIPMHYGSIVGSREDAEEFVRLCKNEGINAEILEQKN